MLYIIINATIIGPSNTSKYVLLDVCMVNDVFVMYRFAHIVCRPYMYACLHTLHRFNVLFEISVALVPCILAEMPSNNL